MLTRLTNYDRMVRENCAKWNERAMRFCLNSLRHEKNHDKRKDLQRRAERHQMNCAYLRSAEFFLPDYSKFVAEWNKPMKVAA